MTRLVWWWSDPRNRRHVEELALVVLPSLAVAGLILWSCK